MARLDNGIFGGFKGKIGDVEGFIRNGIPYIRKKKRKTTTKPSLAKQATMKNMALVNHFIGTMTPFVRLGFSLVAKGMPFTANNAAKSYQLKNSIQGVYPDLSINYTAVRLAEGNLNMPEDITIAREANGLRFTWSYDPVIDWDERRSRAMVLAHVPAVNKSYYFLMAACMNEQSQFMELPPSHLHLTIHAYLSFVAEDHTRIGNSKHFELTAIT